MGKRLIKSTKNYFACTGLTCHLLGIDTVEQLQGPLYGSLFENWVVMELYKARYNQAKDPRLYFYRDVQGKEIDLLFIQGAKLVPIEIKSSKTFSPSFLETLRYFHEQAPSKALQGAVIYVGLFSLFTPENCNSAIA